MFIYRVCFFFFYSSFLLTSVTICAIKAKPRTSRSLISFRDPSFLLSLSLSLNIFCAAIFSLTFVLFVDRFSPLVALPPTRIEKFLLLWILYIIIFFSFLCQSRFFQISIRTIPLVHSINVIYLNRLFFFHNHFLFLIDLFFPLTVWNLKKQFIARLVSYVQSWRLLLFIFLLFNLHSNISTLLFSIKALLYHNNLTQTKLTIV